MYLMIGIWGSQKNKIFAANSFSFIPFRFLFSFGAILLVLLFTAVLILLFA